MQAVDPARHPILRDVSPDVARALLAASSHRVVPCGATLHRRQGTSVLFTGAKPASQAGLDQLIYADALAGVSGPVVPHGLVLWVGGIPQLTASPAIQVGLRVGAMAYLQVTGAPPQRADSRSSRAERVVHDLGEEVRDGTHVGCVAEVLVHHQP